MAPENEDRTCGRCKWWVPYTGKYNLGCCEAPFAEQDNWMKRPITRHDELCRFADMESSATPAKEGPRTRLRFFFLRR
jgi:hypothetical protein